MKFLSVSFSEMVNRERDFVSSWENFCIGVPKPLFSVIDVTVSAISDCNSGLAVWCDSVDDSETIDD